MKRLLSITIVVGLILGFALSPAVFAQDPHKVLVTGLAPGEGAGLDILGAVNQPYIVSAAGEPIQLHMSVGQTALVFTDTADGRQVIGYVSPSDQWPDSLFDARSPQPVQFAQLFQGYSGGPGLAAPLSQLEGTPLPILAGPIGAGAGAFDPDQDGDHKIIVTGLTPGSLAEAVISSDPENSPYWVSGAGEHVELHVPLGDLASVYVTPPGGDRVLIGVVVAGSQWPDTAIDASGATIQFAGLPEVPGMASPLTAQQQPAQQPGLASPAISGAFTLQCQQAGQIAADGSIALQCSVIGQ